MTDTIWSRSRQLDRDRSKKMQELMQEYDETIFYPARKALMKECFKIGHKSGKYHDNGFGWSWFYCNQCGGRYDITGPNGETKQADGDNDA